jgi:hypothetical protein
MSEITFKLVEGDESVDPEFTVVMDGRDLPIAIQDCRSYGGGYSLNLYGLDAEGNVESIQCVGEHGSLAAAKKAAKDLACDYVGRVR